MKRLYAAAMDQDRRVKLIDLAIQKLVQDKRNNTRTASAQDCGGDSVQTNDDEAEYLLALSQLFSLSQLGLLKGEEMIEQSKASSAIQKRKSENVDAGEGCRGSGTDEILKELKEVKRQNFVTHCLLSVMIVLTVAWQLSEVSLIMKIKDGLSHPFRSFGTMLKGMVKVPDLNAQDADNHNKEIQPEPSALPSSMIPEMPHVYVPNLGLPNGNQ